MKKEVSVEKLIRTFEDMANRESLLARGGISQQDLLIQITGTIVHVAMENEKSEWNRNSMKKGGNKNEKRYFKYY